jgi:hypothetical protein
LVLHGELSDQGQIPESLLKEHDDRLIVDLWDDIPLVAEALNKLPKGLSLLLDDTGYIPVDSRMYARGMEVTGEQLV